MIHLFNRTLFRVVKQLKMVPIYPTWRWTHTTATPCRPFYSDSSILTTLTSIYKIKSTDRKQRLKTNARPSIAFEKNFKATVTIDVCSRYYESLSNFIEIIMII